MDFTSVTGTLLLLFTAAVSFQGLRRSEYMDAYKFEVDAILIDREWHRLLSSGFLHGSWLHFGFNMIALLSFSFALELKFGMLLFLGVYFICMLGGSLLALYIHRNHGDYSAVGASGAISGVIFSSIILYPSSSISFIVLPIEIPNWLFGIAFVLISIFGIKSQMGNIGHEAHLGGAITGILATIFIDPGVMQRSWWLILLLLVPTVAFLILIIRNPAVMMVKEYWGERAIDIQDAYTGRKSRMSRQEEVDYLLDKIRTKGINSLTKKERQRLKEIRGE